MNLRRTAKRRPRSIRVLHYACSDIQKHPVQINCISVLEFEDETTSTFSRTTQTEEELLQSFLSYVRENSDATFVAWNMNDTTYGLPAIKKRCEELGVEGAGILDDIEQLDLDQELGRRYGRYKHDYSPHPKLLNMTKHNAVGTLSYLPGKEEVRLADAGDFQPIEVSTNRKVRMIKGLLDLFARRKLSIPNPTRLGKVWLVLESPLTQGLIGLAALTLAGLGLYIAL